MTAVPRVTAPPRREKPLAAAVAIALAVSVAASPPAVSPLAAQEAPAPRLLRPADIDALPLRSEGVRIAYGTDSLQFGDLRLPEGPGPFPVAIVVHGGCWYSPYAAVRNAAPLADALTAAGIATWNIEYRRYDQPGGGWPGTFRDVASAADHLRTLARTAPLDTTRVAAIGHSAGAQLVAWLATRSRLPAESAIAGGAPMALTAVVSLGGVMDMAEFQARQLRSCGNPAVESVLGGLPNDVPERYAATSPIERLPLSVPHVHIAGERDQIAPREVVRTFADSARALGDSVEVITVPGLGHPDVMSPNTAAGRAAVDAVVRWLRPQSP